MTQSSKYITCAIDYVNSIPHLGTAYEKIGADFLSRFYKMMGENVLLQLGNDEHSVNVVKAAQKEGLAPKAYCDAMRPVFENTWRALGVDFDQFIQTSEPSHHKAVQGLFKVIFEKGDIYKKNYQGWYCDSCEAFYTEKDLEDGLCVQHKKKPQWIEEENYFFKLSAYQDFLLNHIEAHPHFIMPLKRKNEVVSFIKQGLQDISVSRPTKGWGIPLPIESDHAVYVWFDALINYITGVGYPNDPQKFNQYWPAHLHIIGKDITRFHCVIWPAMLQSSGLPLPKSIFAHGFVNLKGQKMSKSLGNVVTPLDILNEYPDFGADALRYYLLRTSSFGEDGDFTFEDFITRFNADLANGVGNLVSRTLGMVWRYQQGGVAPLPSVSSEKDWLLNADAIFKAVHKDVDPLLGGEIDTHLALEKILGFVRTIDQYIDEKQPWTLAKNKDTEKLSVVLTTLVEAIRLMAVFLAPFVPQSAQKIWEAFDFESVQPFSSIRFNDLLALPWIQKQHTLKADKLHLFKRIEVKTDAV